MKDILNTNFKEVYPELEYALQTASFIAIDSEFSGIRSLYDTKESLFDTPEKRYTKLRQNIEPFITVQFGITAFRHDQNANKYIGASYNFSLLPRPVPLSNRKFLWQVTAIEFLCRHKFDFNKIAYNGICYVNETEHALLLEQIKKKDFYQYVEQCISYTDEDDLKHYCEEVDKWLRDNVSSKEEYKIETSNTIFQYCVHKELRNRFSNVWTLSGDNSVSVIKVSPATRPMLEKQEGNILEEVLLESYIGFSKVFKLLCSIKKPIIGHNLLLDLMFMHQQFYKPLPNKYTEFKDNIHKLFPNIYDTKYLAVKLNDQLAKSEKLKHTSLNKLYDYIQKQQINIPNSPVVCTEDGSVHAITNFHNAAWDSYYAGYIFVKMAYSLCVQQFGKGYSYKHLTNTELIAAAKSCVNCIHILRSDVAHMNLSGPDPRMSTPNVLFVKSLTSENIDLKEIAHTFAAFGTIDVKYFARQKALVAVANHRSAQNIIRHFRYNSDLQVVPYSPIRHAFPNKYVVWGSFFSILSGGVIAWMLRRSVTKST